MSTISSLTKATSLSAGDKVPLFVVNQGADQNTSLTDLAAFLSSIAVVKDDKVTQYSAPAASATNVQVRDAGDSVFLIITPLAGYAAMTLTFPAMANCKDKQEVLIVCTKAVTALTVAGNGSTVIGAPVALLANDSFRFRFDAVISTWYKVA